jgi:hypothetical protein
MAERPASRSGRASLVKSGTRPTNSGCRYLAAAAASRRNFANDDARRPHAEMVTVFRIALERADKSIEVPKTGDCRQHRRDGRLLGCHLCGDELLPRLSQSAAWRVAGLSFSSHG